METRRPDAPEEGDAFSRRFHNTADEESLLRRAPQSSPQRHIVHHRDASPSVSAQPETTPAAAPPAASSSAPPAATFSPPSAPSSPTAAPATSATSSIPNPFSSAMNSGNLSTNLRLLAQKAKVTFPTLSFQSQGQGMSSRAHTTTTVIKDVFLGIILGLITISVLIFLDHVDVIHLQSAHNFRQTTFQLLNDPEVMADLEESTELKFFTAESVNALNEEISNSQGKIDSAKETYEERVKELEEKSAELEKLKEEKEKLLKDLGVDFEKFCAECSWGGGQGCGKRIAYLMDTYNIGETKAKMAAMERPSCVKSEE